MIGSKVVSIHDDSPCPVVGVVTQQVDDDTVLVRWGQLRQAFPEALDQLMPHRDHPLAFVTIVEPTPIHDAVARDMPRLMRRGRRLRRLIGSVTA